MKVKIKVNQAKETTQKGCLERMSCAIMHFRAKATPFNCLQFFYCVLTDDFTFVGFELKKPGHGDWGMMFDSTLAMIL